ncbi:MAG: putative DNA modification/repair radical SAM protein [Oscillospiraceae bacterium]|jgi:putative DNA modification/repair radical SAM protein|nr:putative DNA modification/repair radical SAM protein [Oscillospiraceae bacterium]
MEISEKLRILSDAAKYDVACTSSGLDRSGERGSIGNSAAGGICHTFTSDGRCVSLLKVLQSNACAYDCQYCINRRSNGDVMRSTFTSRELADLTIQFYRRNYIEGLFLSSAVIGNADNTMEQMIVTLRLLREEYRFRGYIHAKAIPGADAQLVEQLGLLADRMSVNIELPSEVSLNALAPNKPKGSILQPMRQISEESKNSRELTVRTPGAITRFEPPRQRFAPAGQSTQMIVGATAEPDVQILRLTEAMYKKYSLKRVFFSAYIPVQDREGLPALTSSPPLLREHRLYQADWLLRFYGFTSEELLNDDDPNFNQALDPKCHWALHHMEHFPVEINTAPLEVLLRVPGLGVTGCNRIVSARRAKSLDYDDLPKMRISLKRCQYFITCKGKQRDGLRTHPDAIMRGLMSEEAVKRSYLPDTVQLSLFDSTEYQKCLTGQI